MTAIFPATPASTKHIRSGFVQTFLSALEAIEALLGEECTMHESRRSKMALQTGRLPTIKTLSGYDFGFQPSLDRDRVLGTPSAKTVKFPF